MGDSLQYDLDKIRGDYALHVVAEQMGIALARDGREWRALCPFHEEKTPSFTIFIGQDNRERFYCHGCGERGDVIDFAALLHGVDFREACKIISGDAPDVAQPAIAKKASASHDPYEGYKIMRPPADAAPIAPGEQTPPLLNPKRLIDGKPKVVRYTPTLVHPYTDKDGNLLCYVLRVQFDDKKITPCIVWLKNEKTGFAGWSHGTMPEPRPPYRVADIYAHPDKQVLIVEGEKCADAAAAAFPDLVAVSWLGGAKAIHRTNWAHLRNRRLVLWPDNDAEGEAAMYGGYDKSGGWRPGIAELAIEAGCASVKAIRRPGDAAAKGWDVADALAEMSPADCLEWAKGAAVEINMADILARRDRLKPEPAKKTAPEKPAPQSKPVTQEKPAPQAKPEPGDMPPDAKPQLRVVASNDDPEPDWQGKLQTNDEGKLKPKRMTNFVLTLRHHPAIRGTFGFNEMDQNVYVINRPPWEPRGNNPDYTPRVLRDDDITEAGMFLETRGLEPSATTALTAISRASKVNSFHPVREYLDRIEWDGCPRIVGGSWEGARFDPFTAEYFGIPHEGHRQIHAAMFTRWMISAVARIFEPGVKADCMIILESPQGFKKSFTLESLATIDGESYFTDSLHDIDNKDAIMQLQGSWIVEVPEFDAFHKKDFDTIKAFLSRRKDKYRPPYGRTVQTVKRQCVLAATINPGNRGYLRDATGARRFWPIPVNRQIDRDRIIAERDQLWAEAVELYKSGMQHWLTDDESNLSKRITDERYEADPWEIYIDDALHLQTFVTIPDLIKVLEIPRAQANQMVQRRIADHLRRRGWVKRRSKVQLYGRAVWGFAAPGSALAAEDDE